jgi:hypothetical protein
MCNCYPKIGYLGEVSTELRIKYNILLKTCGHIFFKKRAIGYILYVTRTITSKEVTNDLNIYSGKCGSYILKGQRIHMTFF